MNSERNKSLFKRSINHYTVMFMIILLLVMIIVLIVKFSYGDYSFKNLLNDFFNSLIGAIIPLLLFNLIFEALLRRHQSEVVSDAIVETLLLRDETLQKFKEEDRRTFIKNCTQSLIGKEEGEMLYSTLFSPYLTEKQRFRRNFRYNIFYTTYDKLSQPPAIEPFNQPDYVWVIEELSYEKSYLDVKQDLLIGFSYNEQKLETLFKDGAVIFRENLTIRPEDQAVIARLSDEQLKELFRFEFEINGAPSEVLEVKHDDGGFMIKLSHNGGNASEEDCRNCRLKVSFRMPQLKNRKRFMVIISEPTHTVNILFSNQIDTTEVSAVSFFDQEERVSRLPNNLITVDVPDWVLPTSGMVFVWEDHHA